jgi:hypothetical protein
MNNSNKSTPKIHRKPVWTAPWGYTEGWLIALALLITGLAMQIVAGGLNADTLSWPLNIYVGGGFTLLLVAGWTFFRKNVLVQWLTRVPAAIASIGMITFLVLIMGFTLQEDAQNPVWVQRLGLSNMTSSWPFLFGMLFFMASLGMTTLKRLTPMKGRNIGFFLNHAGLYIAIMAGLLGAADLQRYTMKLYEGEVVWGATDRQGGKHDMPLAIELERFNMEEYNPKLTVVESETGRIIPEAGNEMFEINDNHFGSVLGWNVEVLEYHKMSAPVEDRYEPVNDYGAPPSALVRVTDASGNQLEGWITSGSFMYPQQMLRIDHEEAIAMTIPQASHFSSDVVIYTEDGEVFEDVIEVNKPVSAAGWKLYQYSYDDRFGKWSSTSTIEAIRDPWLPVVYTGIFMLVAGSIYLMTLGKAPEKPEEEEPAHRNEKAPRATQPQPQPQPQTEPELVLNATGVSS